MKLQPDRVASANVITSVQPGAVQIADQRWHTSVLLPWEGAVQAWDATDFGALTPAHFERIAALGPELVLFGSGAKLRFAQPTWLAPLFARRIGCESMDTAAACRTYNLLAAEGRKVVAALLLDAPAPVASPTLAMPRRPLTDVL